MSRLSGNPGGKTQFWNAWPDLGPMKDSSKGCEESFGPEVKRFFFKLSSLCTFLNADGFRKITEKITNDTNNDTHTTSHLSRNQKCYISYFALKHLCLVSKASTSKLSYITEPFTVLFTSPCLALFTTVINIQQIRSIAEHKDRKTETESELRCAGLS